MARRTTSIPVTVVSQPKPIAPTAIPTLPQRAPKPVVHDERRKRKMMWWIVGLGVLGAVAVWIWLWPMQMGRVARDTTLDRIANIFHLPTKQESEGEKEIRALDKEVFPQFQ